MQSVVEKMGKCDNTSNVIEQARAKACRSLNLQGQKKQKVATGSFIWQILTRKDKAIAEGWIRDTIIFACGGQIKSEWTLRYVKSTFPCHYEQNEGQLTYCMRRSYIIRPLWSFSGAKEGQCMQSTEERVWAVNFEHLPC